MPSPPASPPPPTSPASTHNTSDSPRRATVSAFRKRLGCQSRPLFQSALGHWRYGLSQRISRNAKNWRRFHIGLLTVRKRQPCDKGPPILNIGILEALYHHFRCLNIYQDFGSHKYRIWIVVSIMPLDLRLDELVSKIFYRFWKFFQDVIIAACLLCAPMINGPVNLLPCCVATQLARTDKQIGGRSANSVEKSIIGRTDRSPKVGLPRLP